MYDLIYKNDFIYKNVYAMGMGEKTLKRMQPPTPEKKTKTQTKQTETDILFFQTDVV